MLQTLKAVFAKHYGAIVNTIEYLSESLWCICRFKDAIQGPVCSPRAIVFVFLITFVNATPLDCIHWTWETSVLNELQLYLLRMNVFRIASYELPTCNAKQCRKRSKYFEQKLPIMAHVRGVFSVGACSLISANDLDEFRFHLDAKIRTDCDSVLVDMCLFCMDFFKSEIKINLHVQARVRMICLFDREIYHGDF